MRNLRAIVRALATQTEAEGRSGVEYWDAFLGRWEALLEAQDLSHEATTDLADLLKPFDGARIRIQHWAGSRSPRVGRS